MSSRDTYRTRSGTINARPSTLHVLATESKAWSVLVSLRRLGTPINLTGATITSRFQSTSGVESSLVIDSSDLVHGKIRVSQMSAVSGKFEIDVTEVGSSPRPLLIGTVAAKSF